MKSSSPLPLSSSYSSSSEVVILIRGAICGSRQYVTRLLFALFEIGFLLIVTVKLLHLLGGI